MGHEESKFIHISIEKYDLLFDQWVSETNAYIDQFNLNNVMKRFDSSCGLKHSENIFDDIDFDNHYRFEVVDGSKFIVSVFKYSLYEEN
jgi:hypothetical protein